MTNIKETNTIEAGKAESSQLWVRYVSRAVIFWAEHMIRTETEGRENLQEAADYVNSEKGGLIITPNHNSYLDAELIKKVRDKINIDKRFVVYWANKFTGKDKGKYSNTGNEDLNKVSLAGKIGMEAARMLNIELIDVPQETSDFAAARTTLRFIEATGNESYSGKIWFW